jgi:hypothetical protein
MMKKILKDYGLSRNSVFPAALLVFLAVCALAASGTISGFFGSAGNSVGIHQLGGQKAFAGEQDDKDAKVDSFLYNDTLIVEDVEAEPGDSFWVTVSLTNTIVVAGFELMLYYDTSIIYPEYNLVEFQCGEEQICTTFAIDGYATARTEDLALGIVWAGNAQGNILDTMTFSALTDVYQEPAPVLPAGGTGPVVKFKFWVRPYAELGVTTDIRFKFWNFEVNNYGNLLIDLLGDDNLIPRTRDGKFTVSTGGPPDNHDPEFTGPTQLSFEVYEGTKLEFWVSATDVDGDTITLSMDPLDLSGLNYHFEQIEGVGSVSQKFDYVPGFDEGPVTRFARFIARDHLGGQSSITVQIKVLETVQDLLMASTLQGGVAGSKDRMCPFMITNSVDIYGFQFTFRWDASKLAVDSLCRTDAIQGFSMYTNLGDSAGKATVLVFGLSGQTIPPGLDTVVYPAFRVHPDAEPGEVDILLENAKEAINPGYPSFPLGMVNGKFFVDMFGDANLDQAVDVGDVVSLVHYILGELVFNTRQMLTADANRDTLVNVGDLVAMIDMIMGRWMGPSPPVYPGPMAVVKLDYGDLMPGSSGEVDIMAQLEVPVAGAQLEINYDPDEVSFQMPVLSERSNHFLMEYRDNGTGRLTVLLYNMANDPIPTGEGSIVSLPVTLSPYAEDTKIELKQVVLADQKAALIPVGDQIVTVPVGFELSQNYPNPFNPSTTIKFTLPEQQGGANLPATLKIYNVLGKVVRTLVNEPMASGDHQVVWDGKDDRGNQAASGIYFYKLRAGDFQDTKKMVLMK